MLRALLDAGLAEEAAARGYRSLLGMLFGSVLTGTAGSGDAKAERAEPVVAYFRRMAAAEELPSLRRVLPALETGDCVQDFAYQLDLLIGGLRRQP
ncbi:MAG TPA: TetR/AcrR family transcriptional regulator C-terminal domain-containing protein [Amycolatopsis sp.]|uniref:TetR/AcrR family transcriptional regulator C-terminal domain-containing protein n=1 Tax=Amycolatopsis sp. TaxID=37632 RepID=UPI002F424AE1